MRKLDPVLEHMMEAVHRYEGATDVGAFLTYQTAVGIPLRLLPEHQGKDIGRLYRRLGFVHTGETDTHDLMEWNSQQGLAPAAVARAGEAEP